MSQTRVRQSGNKTYVARWKDIHGNGQSKGGFTTKKAAEAFENKAKASVAEGVDFTPAKGKMLFHDAAAIWLEGATKNLANHRSILAPAQSRRGDMKTLGVDAVFGDVPLNKITRKYIQDWVNRLVAAGKAPSTVRHNFWTVRMVLEQAVVDGRLAKNPAEYVNPPTDASAARGGVVEDKSQFLTAAQVDALEAATPWPYNVLVYVAPWSGLRAGELGGLTIADVALPANRPAKLTVGKTAPKRTGDEYGTTKTKKSNRTVPLPPRATALLRDYLAEHPHGPASEDHDPDAPLFPNMALTRPRPTGVRANAPEPGATTPGAQEPTPSESAKARARRQAEVLAALTVAEAEARLVLDWETPLRHASFYKAVYRPAVLRANAATRARADAEPTQARAKAILAGLLPEALRFHALRHTYASLHASVDTPVRLVAEYMGHANPLTTETIYTHLYDKDDHSTEMDRFGAAETTNLPGNVTPLARRAAK